MPNSALAVYLAARGFEQELDEELRRKGVRVKAWKERLALAEGLIDSVWAQNIWLDPVFTPVRSIGEAVRALKSRQRNWKAHPVDHFRRAALIEKQLPPVKARPLRFGEPAPQSPLGAWTLWERDLLLASVRCASPFGDGEAVFEEDRNNPPSRAYLKLWEAFTLMNRRPAQGELCLDLGASPGGWTWVLAGLGARVLSIDKSPLDPSVAQLPGVDFCQGSGFGLEPETAGQIDWFFSDMACYPERLLAVVQKWMACGAARNFICTIKLQGNTRHDIVDEFCMMPGSKVIHLFCNKHELTWINLEEWRNISL